MALAGEREYLVEQAKYQDSEGNLLEAIRNHETLLKYDPDNADSHVQIGRLWALLKEKEDSLHYYQVGIELFISEGREDGASDAAEQMQQFWPDSNLSSATRFRLASYLEETGQPQQAIKAFAEIASQDPESAEAQMSLLKIGQLQLISLSDPASATTTLTQFLKTYPKSEWKRFAEETLARAECPNP
jgi:TolA-binding protein